MVPIELSGVSCPAVNRNRFAMRAGSRRTVGQIASGSFNGFHRQARLWLRVKSIDQFVEVDKSFAQSATVIPSTDFD